MKKISLICFILGIVLGPSCYFLFRNDVAINEIGIAVNTRTGEVWKQEPGTHFTSPNVKVINFEKNPIAVELTFGSLGVPSFKREYAILSVKSGHEIDFVKDCNYCYLAENEVKTILRNAYFQKTKPIWLEVHD